MREMTSHRCDSFCAPTSSTDLETTSQISDFLRHLRHIATPSSVVGDVKDWLSDVSRARGAALLGVLNVTPDSFSDGGLHDSADDARAHVDRLLDEASM